MALTKVKSKKKAAVKVDELPEQATVEITNNKGVKVVYVITEAEGGAVNLNSDIGDAPLEGNIAGFIATQVFGLFQPKK